MGGLHRGDDPEVRHPLDVLDAQHLRVLEAESRLRAGAAEGVCHGVEGHQPPAVADRVDGDLEPLGGGRGRDLVHVLAGRHQEAEVAGVVAVGLEQRRAAAPQGAVGVELDATDRQAGVGIDLGAAREPAREQRRVVGEEDGRPQRQLARLAQRRVGADLLLPHPHVGHRGQPQRGAVAGGRDQPAPQVGVRGGRQPPLGEPHRVVDQHAGRMPRRVAQEAAAGGVGDRGIDLQLRHRAGVEQGGMAVDPLEPNGMAGDRRGQRFMGGEALLRPAVLVPSPAAHPGARGELAGRLAHPPHHLFIAGDADQVDLLQRLAEAAEVRVGVDQPRGDGAAGEVDHPGPRAGERRGAGVRPQIDDPPAAHGEAPLDFRRRLDGIEDPVPQDEVGTVLSMGRARRDGERRGEQQKTQGRPHSRRHFDISPGSSPHGVIPRECKEQAIRKHL